MIENRRRKNVKLQLKLRLLILSSSQNQLHSSSHEEKWQNLKISYAESYLTITIYTHFYWKIDF